MLSDLNAGNQVRYPRPHYRGPIGRDNRQIQSNWHSLRHHRLPCLIPFARHAPKRELNFGRSPAVLGMATLSWSLNAFPCGHAHIAENRTSLPRLCTKSNGSRRFASQWRLIVPLPSLNSASYAHNFRWNRRAENARCSPKRWASQDQHQMGPQ